MSPPNGHGTDISRNPAQHSATPVLSSPGNFAAGYTPAQIKEFVNLLEVPFESALIEWRVTNTSKESGPSRGQVIPYADPRAYTDRLNTLFSPAGWTRKYTVHTSANFQRGKDKKTTAKVFVTCDLTIFGIGSHSATGEEWADDENAGTSAEAQAFKRACSCFGLGRYLYHFTGIWVDLDGKKRAKTRPVLFGWATPEGWKQGLRPGPQETPKQQTAAVGAKSEPTSTPQTISRTSDQTELIRQIESMAQPLGRRLYRGVLKTVAQVWRPDQIGEVSVLRNVLNNMRTGDELLNRLSGLLQQTGPELLGQALRSLGVKSLGHLENIEQLQKILCALEPE